MLDVELKKDHHAASYRLLEDVGCNFYMDISVSVANKYEYRRRVLTRPYVYINVNLTFYVWSINDNFFA